MTRHVRTTTPSGEKIVIVPAGEYDRLIAAAEDLQDAAIADRALADLRAGRSETLNSEEMTRLVAGPTPLAFWRRKRNFTQKSLAERVGVTQAYLAQIETRRREGPVGLYAKLAAVLSLRIEDLVIGDG